MVDEGPATPIAEETHPQQAGAAAERALAEAELRRAAADLKSMEAPAETQGRGGLEPTRYGDWEVKGLASDF